MVVYAVPIFSQVKLYFRNIYFTLSLRQFSYKVQNTEAAVADVLQNKFLKNFANFLGKHMCWSLFFIKLQPLNKTFFYRTLLVAASKNKKSTELESPLAT